MEEIYQTFDDYFKDVLSHYRYPYPVHLIEIDTKMTRDKIVEELTKRQLQHTEE